MKTLIKNVDIVTDQVTPNMDILIEDDTIKQIASSISESADCVIDGSGLTAMPGLYDMHVHLRDPGQTYKEDIITGTAAALAGGITGCACMPNTTPRIDTAETIHYIIEKAAPTGVSVNPVACITNSMQGKELCDYEALKNAGAIAVSDDGRPVENAEMMRQALIHAYKVHVPVISHCEDLSIINGGIINQGEVSEQLQVKGMDRSSEEYITAREMILAASTHTAIHIAHVSTKGCVDMIRFAKSQGVQVTCETCPHYFLMTEKEVLTRDADYRMNPPLRTEEDRQAILEGLLDGTIDCIVTDHAPHSPEEKSDFLNAPNGVIGMETSLAATLTLVHENKMTLPEVVQKMAINPRRILNLPQEKIQEGNKATLILVDLNHKWIVDPEKLHSKAKNAVWKGRELTGKTMYTIVNGAIRYQYEN